MVHIIRNLSVAYLERLSPALGPRLSCMWQMAVISGVGVRRYYERFGYRTLKDYQASWFLLFLLF